MIYENFQNLESEEKNQERRKGNKKGGMESPKFALSMSIRVCAMSIKVRAVLAHRAPVCSGTLQDPITSHIQGPQRDGDRKTQVTCAMWKGMGSVHGVLGLE